MADPSEANTPDHADAVPAPPHDGQGRLVCRLGWVAFALLCVFPLFFSLGNHPIHGDSEARYGVVARGMALGQTPLLVPTYFDQPHLTKPPLTYWLMAGSIRLLGDGELALRIPAALSGVLTLAIVFGLGYRLHGARRAAVATAILSVTPMFVVISRMGITDGLLGLFSTAALACGVLAVKDRRGYWVTGLWLAVALGLLTKGPAALLAPGALMIWLLVTGQRESLRRIRPVLGLLAALLPLAGWALLIAWQHPEAWAIWKYQTFDRAVGTGDHPEPWWFFFPVLLVGLLPATALLLAHRPAQLRVALAELRESKSEVLLWLMMAGLTLLVFTLISGKLMSYLMPLAAPLAWWVGGEKFIKEEKTKKYKYQYFVFFALLVCLALAFGMIWRDFGPAEAAYLWPLVLVLIVGATLDWRGVWRSGSRKITGSIAMWLAMLNVVAWACIAEDRVYGRHSVPAAVAEVRAATGLEHPQILTVGFGDRSLPYYTQRPTRWIDPRVLPDAWEAMRKDDLILLADPEKWDIFDADPYWDLSQRFERVDLEVLLGYEGQRLRVYQTTQPYRQP
ncbi:ArnT family glycosyltransferase [Algisphaera agarilytica]|uniref:4-amino-4-deoxy-L-arabinose transferase-like glycosyltransferase n=1 Tax=Algisphaera agarilytica TaxID=1385975 RepID=A0A7X0H8Q5_9BACT|nr:glycosyltransferase family 39 protein [Algisphaera agarilytica]MBB6429864.1 4-amino-4-deoxy-L-arabinose transferase-like glycosyltransferase [Algisphaera agarilytica]